MAKPSNTSVVLLMMLIAAWRTTPVLSHAKPELDYGPAYDEIFSSIDLHCYAHGSRSN